ncbi:MAG TPA: LamG domain-containing protein [Verrucomicrobiota bacterium]|nr:LamG domain-containing protein [Verrucomicrobiota bacterium]
MRPVTATLEFDTPFVVLKQPVALKARDRKPTSANPKVRVSSVRANAPESGVNVAAIADGSGLADTDGDGLFEHDCEKRNMWMAQRAPDLFVEFELPEAVPLASIEIWNFNDPWQTTNGVRRADIRVSTDGSTWETALAGAEFTEAEGNSDYDQRTVLRLNGVKARKVRFENLVSFGTGSAVGISEVVFREAVSARAAPLKPEDGSTGVGIRRTALEWTAVPDASAYSVYLGISADALRRIGTTDQLRFELSELKPDTTYYWRVDAVPARGRVVSGRVAAFRTTGLVAWWKFEETTGTEVPDASGCWHAAQLRGPVMWAPRKGRFGGAIELNGSRGYVDCRFSPAMGCRSEMTVSVWMKVREFDKPNQAIINRSDNAWRIERHGEHDAVQFVLVGPKPGTSSKTNQVVLVSKRPVADGQWHHIAATYDGLRAALYVDGVEDDAMSAAGEILSTPVANVVIGASMSERQHHFDGWIDDVRIYGCAISTEAIQELYRAGPD